MKPMKRITLITAITLLTLTTQAQTRSDYMERAGNHLALGVGMQVGGAAVIGIGAANTNSGTPAILGGALSVAGIVLEISAGVNLKKAADAPIERGRLSLGTTRSGVGLTYEF